MQIHCESCGTPIPPANINIQEKLAVCPQCGSVFSFAGHLRHGVNPRKTKQPRHFIVNDTGDTLDIEFRLLRVIKPEEHWFTVLCGVGMVALGALSVAMFRDTDTIWKAALSTAVLLGALACLYMVLMIFLDQIHLTVDRDEVRARHRPLMLGNCTVPRDEIVRVECAVAFYSRDNPDDELADYHVRLVRHDGSEKTLVTLRRDLAFYVAHAVETYLRDDDLPPDAGDEDEDQQRLMLLAEENTTEARSAQ